MNEEDEWVCTCWECRQETADWVVKWARPGGEFKGGIVPMCWQCFQRERDARKEKV